ncbi:uncharacterized protein JN550_013122 [Neoarthrinium moseri]|uniref:uncharacterized protein n=1 Tax=Neoarthrinium moseri TaxID=1658444 RepID=UPI001FDB1624|nr:uncharacterized protein JN550_013122 [Neoarthrinium moseri]KAI1857610.1 hypothetical protein JN550_013122 [Neoarthrinium moseri]
MEETDWSSDVGGGSWRPGWLVGWAGRQLQPLEAWSSLAGGPLQAPGGESLIQTSKFRGLGPSYLSHLDLARRSRRPWSSSLGIVRASCLVPSATSRPATMPMEPAMRSAASHVCRRCSQALRTQAPASSRAFSRAALRQPGPRSLERPARPFSLFGQKTKTNDEGVVQFGSGAPAPAPAPDAKGKHTPVLRPDDLFHSYTNSPIPEIRHRAAYMRQHALCPHPDHRPTRLPTTPDDVDKAATTGSQPPAHVSFECPDCGIPVSCSEEHWADDYEAHLQICDTLRQINEDDHDLRSGRFFPEFEYAGPQMEEAAVNMTNWDTFLYTRQFEAVNDDRSMRQVTRLLTYPITVGSILHELSPYSIRDGGRITPEGLKSFSALRYTLHPPKTGGGEGIRGLRPEAPPVRIFILGARAESSLPRNVWVQLAHLFPRGKFHLVFIGPESMSNRDDEFPLPPRTPSNPFGTIVEDRVWPSMKISTIVDYYHTIHKTGHFEPYDPYFDCFVLFHPGLGHPASSHEWAETIPMLLETKAPIIATGYTQFDMERDIEWVNKTCGGEFDLLMEPGENTFRSQRWDLNDQDPQDVTCGNWGVWAFRGKRYETTHKDVQ